MVPKLSTRNLSWALRYLCSISSTVSSVRVSPASSRSSSSFWKRTMATASRMWHSRACSSSVAFLTPFMGSRGSGRLWTVRAGLASRALNTA